MNRRKFMKYSAGVVVIAGVTYYFTSDISNFERADVEENLKTKIPMQTDEETVLVLASLEPSGHNTQPWLVKYHKPYNWTICNNKAKWLPGVDPTQRETILSIGAFVQNLEYAANSLGYDCKFDILPLTNQDEDILNVKLFKSSNVPKFEIEKIQNRRTLRSNYLNINITKNDLDYLFKNETEFVNYFPNTSKQHLYLNAQTIKANRVQAYRDDAQTELSNWIRFSNHDVKKYRDGLTPASMEISGISGWVVRNFYDKQSVMKTDFREKSIDTVKTQVAQSAGWIIITSINNSVASLLDTGKRLQRIWLKVRDKNIAIHPMTQILEEEKTRKLVNKSLEINQNIQFLLRVGYVENYLEPVSLRRSVQQFVTT